VDRPLGQALLAEALGPGGAVEFHNLAVSGARAADVAAEQLPRAVVHRPDLAAVLVGINDILRRDFDAARVGVAMACTVDGLGGCGGVVLTACLPDPGRMFRLPAALARPLGRRVAELNAVMHGVAERYRSLHLHIPLLPGVYDRRMWSVDRLHPVSAATGCSRRRTSTCWPGSGVSASRRTPGRTRCRRIRRRPAARRFAGWRRRAPDGCSGGRPI
jgi:lysophospholipase L1-like esterase